MNIVGPLTSIALPLPGGNQVAYNVVGPAVIKSLPGFACGVICLSSGGLSLYDGSVTATSALTNQFFANSSITQGQVIPLSNMCATGIVASVNGGVFAVPFS